MSAARTKPARTCAELGVCHGRPTLGCTCSPSHHARAALPPDGFFFAPGAIEGGGPRKRRWLHASTVDAIGRAVLAAAACAALAAAIGFSAGWLSVKGPLL